jgi:hypothetical protein
MTNHTTPKPLTNDEKKAADAAFAGRPFNSSWSTSARIVYDGIMNALPKEVTPAVPEEVEAVIANLETTLPVVSVDGGESLVEKNAKQDDGGEDQTAGPGVPTIRDRQEAIQAGVLIDVTPTAQQLGLTFPVTITNPLWDIGIVTDQSLSEEEQAGRLRDVLMAFRLKLASLATISPLIDFPAMLSMPPSTVPQPVPLFAIIQPDAQKQASVTLLLPNEVSLSITNSN